jgi:hypothetical protein
VARAESLESTAPLLDEAGIAWGEAVTLMIFLRAAVAEPDAKGICLVLDTGSATPSSLSAREALVPARIDLQKEGRLCVMHSGREESQNRSSVR